MRQFKVVKPVTGLESGKVYSDEFITKEHKGLRLEKLIKNKAIVLVEAAKEAPKEDKPK